MLQSCTKRYTDESSEQMFWFTFYCDLCGRPFHSAPIPFSGGFDPKTSCEIELWKLRWQQEHAKAFDRANHEAKLRHFCCPGCGKCVCPECVAREKVSADESRDWCRDCSDKRSIQRLKPFRMVPRSAIQREGDADAWEKPFARIDQAIHG